MTLLLKIILGIVIPLGLTYIKTCITIVACNCMYEKEIQEKINKKKMNICSLLLLRGQNVIEYLLIVKSFL